MSLRAVPAWVWLVAIVPLATVGVGVASGLSVRGLRSVLAGRPRPLASASAAPATAPLPFAPLAGEAADLSSIMGRARKLADGWQREAALLGIEALLERGKVQTPAGASAKLTFGPSPFANARPASDLFVVVYDKGGLRGTPTAGRAGKALPEPMCAPEHVLKRVLDLGDVPVSLRYGYDDDERALWFTTPAHDSQQLRVFDPRDCGQRGNVVVVPRPRR